jgi:hypothetical protein
MSLAKALEYSSFVVSQWGHSLVAATEGVTDGLTGLKETVMHPYDNVIHPLSLLTYDATVLLAAHAPPDALDPNTDWINTQKYVLSHSTRYQESLDRLTSQVSQIELSLLRASIDPAEQIRLISGSSTAVFVPGFMARGAKAAAIAFKNKHDFGTFLSPPVFHNNDYAGLSQTVPLPMVSPQELSRLADKQRLMYVITDDKKLLVAHSMAEIPSLRDSRGNYMHHYLFHPELASLKPVYAAGDVVVEGGKILYLDNKSGHYLPAGSHLRTLVEKAFKDNGFEATGKYREINLLEHDPILFTKKPIISKHTLSFSPGGEAPVFATLAAGQKLSLTAKDLSPLLQGKIAEAKTAEDLIHSIDGETEARLRVEGSPADRVFLDQIYEIQEQKSALQEAAQKTIAFESIIRNIETLQGVSFALGNTAQLAHKLGNPDLARGLNGLGAVASLGAGLQMLSLGFSFTGVGTVIAGATALISSFQDEQDDASGQVFQMMAIIDQKLDIVLQEVQGIKKYLIESDRAKFSFWIQSFFRLENHLLNIQERALYQDYQLSMIRMGIDFLIDSSHEQVLSDATSYGGVIPLSELTKPEYLRLMIGLNRLIAESHKPLLTGVATFKAEETHGTLAAWDDLRTLIESGKEFGYFSQRYKNPKYPAWAFNPRLWVGATNLYAKLRGAPYPQVYDGSLKQIRNIYQEGEVFLNQTRIIQNDLYSQMPPYFQAALSAIAKMRAALTYPEMLIKIASGTLGQGYSLGTLPAGLLHSAQDDRFLFDRGGFKHAYVNRGKADAIGRYRDCHIPQAFYTAALAGLGKFNVNWMLKLPAAPGATKFYSRLAEAHDCVTEDCPQIKFTSNGGWEISVYHGVNAYWYEHQNYCRSAPSGTESHAINLLNGYRRTAMQEKSTELSQLFPEWKIAFFNLDKAKVACVIIGFSQELCASIPSVPKSWMDFTYWSSALMTEVNAPRSYRDALPDFSGLLQLLTQMQKSIEEAQLTLSVIPPEALRNPTTEQVAQVMTRLQYRIESLSDRSKRQGPLFLSGVHAIDAAAAHHDHAYTHPIHPSHPIKEWSCESLTPDLARCEDLTDPHHWRLLAKRDPNKSWQALSHHINFCEKLENGVKRCEGPDIIFEEHDSFPGMLNLLSSAVLYGAFFAAIPELGGDLLAHYGYLSKKRVAQCQAALNYGLLTLSTLSALRSSDTLPLLALISFFLTYVAMIRHGFSSTTSRLAGNTANIFVKSAGSPFSIAVSVAHLAGGYFGLKAEKAAMRAWTERQPLSEENTL